MIAYFSLLFFCESQLQCLILILSYYFVKVTFEDKRKLNYEKGRQELERRRKEIQDRLQKEKVKSLAFAIF